MRVAEIFHSIQGEGILIGVPSVFVRTSGCNLRCRWCDTPYTSWQPTGDEMTVDDVVATVAGLDTASHVVVTGGEPLIAKGVDELSRKLRQHGLHITIETAGTVYTAAAVDLLSISPKLANSDPNDDGDGWRQRHQQRRENLDVLRRWVAEVPYQLKFVVSQPGDLDEIRRLTDAIGARDKSRILLMPESRSGAVLRRQQSWVAALCAREGYRFGDRLHLRLFGNTRGT